jgi:hypothetical protein
MTELTTKGMLSMAKVTKTMNTPILSVNNFVSTNRVNQQTIMEDSHMHIGIHLEDLMGE